MIEHNEATLDIENEPDTPSRPRGVLRVDSWLGAPNATWQQRADVVRSHRAIWPVLYGGVFAAQATMLLLAGRNQWYFFDEWRLIVERIAAPGDVNLFERLFRPDGEHVIAVPLALFVVLANIGGLDAYWPFIVANVLVRLATMWVADDIVRRLGGRRIARLMVLVSIAFFGEGFESLFGQSLIFAGVTLVFSLLAVREAIRDDVSMWRATVLATIFLVVAVFSTSYAFPVVLAVALILGVMRGVVPGLVALAVPPLTFLAVRALAGGSYSEQQAISPRFAGAYVDYVQVGLTSVGEGVTGLVGLGLASFVLVVVLGIMVARDRRAGVLLAAMTLAVVAFYGQASLSRSALGAGQAASTRYLFFCGVLVLVMLGSTWGARRVPPRLAVVVAVLFIVSISNHVGRLADGYDFYIPEMQLSQDRLLVGFVLEDQFELFVPDPDWAPDLSSGRLDAVVAWDGTEQFLEEGQVCVDRWVGALDDLGLDLSAYSEEEIAALVLLLNEHSLGYGVPGADFGDLVGFAAGGNTSSKVLDQLTAVYVELTERVGDNPAVPARVRC